MSTREMSWSTKKAYHGLTKPFEGTRHDYDKHDYDKVIAVKSAFASFFAGLILMMTSFEPAFGHC
jgi:hypothetical protein